MPRAAEYLLTWHMFTACGAHDAHNAMTWALLHRCRGGMDMMKSAWVATESLANSSGQI